MIEKPDTVVDPWAVVVHVDRAPLTGFTVVSVRRLHRVAVEA